MINRIGVFFLVVGFLAVVIFAASLQENAPDTITLLIAILALVVGFFLATRNKEPQKAERFRLLKKLSEKRKKK